MNSKIYFAILLLVLPLMSYSQSDSLEYSLHVVSKDTTFSAGRKLELSLEYPSFSNAGINQIILSFLTSTIFGETKFASIDELWSESISEYSSLVERGPGHSAGWVIDRSVKVLLNKSGILSLEFAEMTFTGGAHPNSKVVFINYDLKKNEIVSLRDLFIKDYARDLNAIAESCFRLQIGLNASESLREAGFHFTDGKFSINENYALTNTGLLFYFNQYEIASYAAGAFRIAIPYSDLEKLAKRGSMIRKLTH